MKKAAVALLFVLAALALVACGGSDSSSSESSAPAESTSESGGGEAEGAKEGGAEAEGGSAGSAATVDFEAAASGLEFTTDFDEAEAGKVTVNFTNPQAVPHDVAIETENGEVLGQTEELTEGSDSTTIDLKPGTYTYFCTVPGHREAGMEGTLTVK